MIKITLHENGNTTEEMWNVTNVGCGVECGFFDLGTGMGVKLYIKRSNAEDSMNRQMKLNQVQMAPDVYGGVFQITGNDKVELLEKFAHHEKGDSWHPIMKKGWSVYGYRTEVVTPIRDFLSDEAWESEEDQWVEDFPHPNYDEQMIRRTLCHVLGLRPHACSITNGWGTVLEARKRYRGDTHKGNIGLTYDDRLVVIDCGDAGMRERDDCVDFDDHYEMGSDYFPEKIEKQDCVAV
jgi:hypothetical protein